MKLLSHSCFLFLKPVPDNCTGTVPSVVDPAFHFDANPDPDPDPILNSPHVGKSEIILDFYSQQSHFTCFIFLASIIGVIDFNTLYLILKSGKNYSLTQNLVEMDTGIRFRIGRPQMPIRIPQNYADPIRSYSIDLFYFHKGRLSWSRLKNRPYPTHLGMSYDINGIFL